MLDNNSIYRRYYGWWKNIDKTIFMLIIFLFSLGLFFSSKEEKKIKIIMPRQIYAKCLKKKK